VDECLFKVVSERARKWHKTAFKEAKILNNGNPNPTNLTEPY